MQLYQGIRAVSANVDSLFHRSVASPPLSSAQSEGRALDRLFNFSVPLLFCVSSGLLWWLEGEDFIPT